MGGTGKLRGWRRSESTAPGADLSSMERLDLIDITLLSAAEGAAEVPRLGLRFDATGFTVRRWDGETVATIPWVSLRRLRPLVNEEEEHAGRVELEVETDRKSHRFAIPNVSVEALKASLAAMSARYAHLSLVTDQKQRGRRQR